MHVDVYVSAMLEYNCSTLEELLEVGSLGWGSAQYLATSMDRTYRPDYPVGKVAVPPEAGLQRQCAVA